MPRFLALPALAFLILALPACSKKADPAGPGAAASSTDPEAPKKALADLVAERGRLVKSAGTSPSKEDRTKLDLLSGEIQKKMAELEPGSDEKKQALLEEIMAKYQPEIWKELKAARQEAMGVAARAQLKELQVQEELFRATDPDGDGAMDYWVADVSGMNRIRRGGSGEAIQLIGGSVARADARPCVATDAEGEYGGAKFVALGPPAAKSGYWLAAVPRYEGEGGKETAYDAGGKGTNPGRFAFCAWPEVHGTTGVLTFLITEAGEILQKDTGGKPVDIVPADLAKAGWAGRK